MRRRNSPLSHAFDPELERSLRQIRKAKRTVIEQPISSSSSSSSPTSTPPTSPPRITMPKLSDEGMPTAAQVPTGTLNPNLTATKFKIDPSFYNLVRKEQFGGALNEDPATHINRFCDLCQMITDEDVTQDQLKRMMFPHSLKDKASSWLRMLSAAESNTWGTLVLAFYRKFFPPERTANLRMQITGFRQRLNESLYEAWERFKGLERQCPHHNFGAGFMAMTFYNSLTADSRRILDSAANGQFDTVEVADARGIIEKMANHSVSYVQSSYTTVGAVAGETFFQDSVTSQIADLKAQLASLKVDSSPPIVTAIPPIGGVQSSPLPMICNACGLYGHTIYTCQGTQEQVAAFHNYQQTSPYGQSFQQPYKQPYQAQFHQGPPPGNTSTSSSAYQHPNKPQAFKAPSFTDMNDLKTMLMGMQKSQEHLIAQVAKLDAEKSSAIKSMESQIAQLAASQAQRQQGQLPSQPNHPTHTLNAIHLRSGASYDSPSMPTVEQKKARDKGEPECEAEASGGRFRGSHRSVGHTTDRHQGVKGTGKSSGAGLEKDLMAGNAGTEVKLPFPRRLKQKSPFEEQFGKFKEVLAKLNITIPFLDLVLQVPSYTKFLKDLLNRKKALPQIETIALTERCSAPQLSNSPPKLGDPGSFSIPCTIGALCIDNALCDLGASVSVLPLSLAKKVGLTQFKSSNMTIQMADRTISRPLGVLEDVPVQIGGFYIPVDFVVLDIPEDAHIPIILGRPFLHTTGALIDVGKKTLTFKVGGELLVFKPSTAPRSPLVFQSDLSIKEQFQQVETPTDHAQTTTGQNKGQNGPITLTPIGGIPPTDRHSTHTDRHQGSHRSVVGLKTPVSCVVESSCVITDFMAPSHYSGDPVESVCCVPSLAGSNSGSYLNGLEGKSLSGKPMYGMLRNSWSNQPSYNTPWQPALLQDDFGDTSDGGSYSDPII